jgi:CheY-like chemotaxis protein
MGRALGAVASLPKAYAGEALIRAVRSALRPNGGLNVLVVDDDPETRQLVADTLGTDGHGATLARNATEAIRALNSSQIDAVVLDLMLPGRNGFELLAELRANPKWQQLPVLVLTVKDLVDREREVLAGYKAKVFAKGSGWRRTVLDELQGIVRRGLGKTVLVADDNPAGRELVREGLSDHVAQIVEASDGREALRKIRETRPDLVLLDIQMPEMDGYEVLRHIRSDSSLEGLRVVALTAFAMQGDRERAMEAGFDDYITKPLTIRKLKAQLDLPRGSATEE